MQSADDPSAGSLCESSPRLHVLRVADVSGAYPGGVARVVSVTSALLIDRGYVIDHLFSEDMPTWGPRAWRRILVPFLVAFHVVRLKLRGEAPDVVEIHGPLGAPYALARKLIAPGQLPPMVAFSHGLEERGWHLQRTRWYQRGQRGPMKSRILVPLTLISQATIVLRLADVVVVLSSKDREFLLSKRGMRSERIHRIDNGVEADLLALRRPPRPADGSVLILFVGTWTDRKGTPELVQAFVRLRQDHPGARLVVGGSGCGLADVLSRFPVAVRPHVEVRPSLTRRELYELLGRADIFVLPSWFEGMPLSLLEAAAAGLPIVASDTCGIRDVLRPADPGQDGGLLVPPHDGMALHAALDGLVRQPALRARLGERARTRAHDFPWANSTDALERIYIHVAADRTG